MNDEKVSIGIIGGTGELGQWFKHFFESKGFKVLIASRKTELTPKQLVEKSNVTIYCIPINSTVKVIEETAKFARPGSALTDFTSVKEVPLKALLKNASEGVEVFGMHPIFGPTVESLQGQNIAMCKGNSVKNLKWYNVLKQLFESENARVIECTAIEHDNAMAAVQVLSHLTLASLKKTLQELSAEKITAFSSPVFEKLCELIERIGMQNPELYPSIFLNNKQSLQVAKALQDNVGFFKELIEKKDFEGLKKFYESLLGGSKN